MGSPVRSPELSNLFCSYSNVTLYGDVGEWGQ